MPKGMRVPIKVADNGGSMMLDGPATIGQNVILAVKPAGSLHPWNQHITPEENLVFDLNDERTGGLYTMQVRQFFSEMESRGFARLYPGRKGLRIVPSGRDRGDMIVMINYVNLETGKASQLSFPIGGNR